MRRFVLLPSMIAIALAPAGAQQVAPPPAQPTVPAPPAGQDGVRTTIVPGTGTIPAPQVVPDEAPRAGDVRLDFPGVDVQQVARAVFGGILRVPYTIDPSLNQQVTVVTDRPIARSSVLPFLEGAFRAAGLAIINNNGTYVITTVEQARTQATLTSGVNTGFGNETYTLRFIGAQPLKQLVDTILPGVVAGVDAGSNTVTIAGTTGQRRAVRELIERFDVNWLRNMSFALYVPKRTDARLIVPELEKLVDSPGAPTAGLVRLIAMERLNGILAVSSQPQYLEDVRRWVEILDREGQNNQPRLFVYRVQNGRSSDLAKTLLAAFGMGGRGGGDVGQGPDQDSPFGSPSSSDTVSGNGNRSAPARSTMTRDASTPSGSPLQSGTAERPAPPRNGAAGETGETATPGASDPQNPLAGLTITSDDVNNAVVVYGTPQTYAIVEDALRKLDIPPLQVMIEVAITEVRLTNELRYGVQWLFGDGDFTASQVAGSTANPTRIFPGLSLGYSNGTDIVATLNALEEMTTVNVVSAPKLLVINNQTASLQVGDQVPVSSSSAVSVENPDAPIVNAIEYRDTGVILKITPRVNSGGLVLLDISQEVSDVSETETSDINSPTISTRRLASSIAVQDGRTLALGGLISATRSRGNSGIPLLSRIPVLGALFGTKSQNDRRTELLILLRPRVIRSPDDGRAITDELREKIQSLRPGFRGADL